MKNTGLLGKVGIFIVAIIWGSGFTFSALALEHFTTFQVIALRFTIAFLILLAINFQRLKEITWAHLKDGIWIGIVLFIAYALQTTGLEYTTASKNSFLTSLNVVLVPFLAYLLFKTPISKNSVLGALIALFGIQLTSFSGVGAQLSFNIGDALTIVSAVFFAGHLIYTEHFGKRMEAWMLMTIQMGVAGGLSWLMVLFTGQTHMTFTTQGMMPILYIGIIATLVAYGLQTISQKHTTSGESAVILSTEAFFGMLTAVIVLGEPLLMNMIIGGAVIFAGIIIVELKPFKENASQEELDSNQAFEIETAD